MERDRVRQKTCALPASCYTVPMPRRRDHVREHVLALAEADPRVVAGAVVGSLADGDGDDWSDLDLTFAVDEGATVDDVLSDWTDDLAGAFGAVKLVDVAASGATYRVLLLDDGLQFDLSFAPASSFGAAGPKFRLLFGDAVEKPHVQPRAAADVFGWAVVYVRHARASIDRGRFWQAEHYVHAVRDHALELACRRLGLPTSFGRGYDDLPADVLAGLDGARVRSLERDELLRALAAATEGLLREAVEVAETAVRLEPRVRAWLA